MTAPASVPVDTLPWVPLRPGMWMRPMCFLDDGYSLQLRVAPGTRTGPHRHTGEVHALTVSGHRRIYTSGERLGPGSFLHEPPGNEDEWGCEGEQDCIVVITLKGRIDYLAADGGVDHHTDTHTAQSAYLDHCARAGLAPVAALFQGTRRPPGT
jgi:2,4'-dihydroxyacetophenone dioxygenase